MARNKSSVAGLTIKDITRMTETKFQSYSQSDQRKIVSRLVSAANKRIRSFERKGIESPAIMGVNETGGKFSIKGKDELGLLKELTRVRGFLRNPSSTIKGWQKVEKKTLEGLKQRGIEVDKEHISDITYALGQLSKERNLTRAERYKILEKMSVLLENNTDMSTSELLSNVHSELDTIYRETQDYYDEASISDFFTVR